MNILTKIKGWKKISAALIGLITIVLQDTFSMEPSMVENIVSVLTYYIVGQGIADAGADYKKAEDKVNYTDNF